MLPSVYCSVKQLTNSIESKILPGYSTPYPRKLSNGLYQANNQQRKAHSNNITQRTAIKRQLNVITITVNPDGFTPNLRGRIKMKMNRVNKTYKRIMHF